MTKRTYIILEATISLIVGIGYILLLPVIAAAVR